MFIKNLSILRRDLSTRLDLALKDAGAGKWFGGTSKLDNMEIFIRATDAEKALDIIRSALAEHWVFPLMEVRRPKNPADPIDPPGKNQ